VLDDGSLYFEHLYEGGYAGQTVTITMQSPDFDTYLSLIDVDGNEVMANDDASGTDSAFTVELPYTGPYIIRAKAYSQGEQGSYLITVN